MLYSHSSAQVSTAHSNSNTGVVHVDVYPVPVTCTYTCTWVQALRQMMFYLQVYTYVQSCYSALWENTGQSLSEIFATKNKVVYFSPTVHTSYKLTTAT